LVEARSYYWQHVWQKTTLCQKTQLAFVFHPQSFPSLAAIPVQQQKMASDESSGTDYQSGESDEDDLDDTDAFLQSMDQQTSVVAADEIVHHKSKPSTGQKRKKTSEHVSSSSKKSTNESFQQAAVAFNAAQPPAQQPRVHQSKSKSHAKQAAQAAQATQAVSTTLTVQNAKKDQAGAAAASVPVLTPMQIAKPVDQVIITKKNQTLLIGGTKYIVQDDMPKPVTLTGNATVSFPCKHGRGKVSTVTAFLDGDGTIAYRVEQGIDPVVAASAASAAVTAAPAVPEKLPPATSSRAVRKTSHDLEAFFHWLQSVGVGEVTFKFKDPEGNLTVDIAN
jgi:chemotaxis protein histidine kinase CheA